MTTVNKLFFFHFTETLIDLQSLPITASNLRQIEEIVKTKPLLTSTGRTRKKLTNEEKTNPIFFGDEVQCINKRSRFLS